MNSNLGVRSRLLVTFPFNALVLSCSCFYSSTGVTVTSINYTAGRAINQIDQSMPRAPRSSVVQADTSVRSLCSALLGRSVCRSAFMNCLFYLPRYLPTYLARLVSPAVANSLAHFPSSVHGRVVCTYVQSLTAQARVLSSGPVQSMLR